MHSLKSYCCALSPDILEGLIELLGDTETKHQLGEYKRNLCAFQCETKLKDLVGNYDGPTPPEYKEVQLKFGDNWREKTLADLKILRSQVSYKSWLLKVINTGSLTVTFLVPSTKDLDLGVHLRDYLKSQCVLQIIMDGACIFNCEGILSKIYMYTLFV